MAPRFNLIKAGAFYCPLPEVFIPLQDIQIFYRLFSDWHVIKLTGLLAPNSQYQGYVEVGFGGS